MSSKVLVVDDNEDICAIVSTALKNKGIDVRIAETGNDSICIFNEFHPDVVLLDFKLPDMNGNEVARIIKNTGKKTDIITMTGEDVSPSDLDMTLYAGLLKKPFKLTEMVEYVEKHINK